MKHHVPLIVKRSMQYSFSIISGASAIAGLWGYTVRDICRDFAWWLWLLILFGVFLFFFGVIFLIIRAYRHRSFSTTINGKPVIIKVGDLFSETGWKLIPCNERFDTVVDDCVIVHDTLNGKFIDKYVNDFDELNKVIEESHNDTSTLKAKKDGDKTIYPLGRIIPYKDFMMLAFSHFDEQNTAYVGFEEYEQLLIRMWREMRRVYAAKHIAIPLIGSGITDIRGLSEKNYTELLKCILCTLKRSKFQPNKGITIILTSEVMDNINMNLIREEF